jgi:hemin uptake protein HemP
MPMFAPQDTSPAIASTAHGGHASPSVPAPPVVALDSLHLLQGQREVQIRHGNETYRLRHTRNDKLILTK